MKKKPILYYDLDGVIVNFNEGLLRAAARDLEEVNEETLKKLKPEEVDELILKTEGFYENLPPIPGAVEAVREMMNHFEVYFLSTPMWGDPKSYTGKRIWVEKHFGEDAKKKLILTHRKDLAIGDYLVDDRTKHGAGEFKGVHIHFGTEKFPDHAAVNYFLFQYR